METPRQMSLRMRLTRLSSRVRRRAVRRTAIGAVLACGLALAAWRAVATKWSARTTARLDSATERLDALTEIAPADDNRRAAIAWGYAERLRLGLESPFRLIEAAARDPRLTAEERRTVAWAVLARVARGETHDIDPAALDGLGPVDAGRSVTGDQHLRLIQLAIAGAGDPRAAELAVRFAYTLAVAERLVDVSAPVLAAEAAAMLADREISRREASEVIRAARGADPLDVVRRRRDRRAFYVERPALLSPTVAVERAAIGMTEGLLVSLRSMRPVTSAADAPRDIDPVIARLAPRLFAAGALMPPAAPLAVTVRRYFPLVKAQTPRLDHDALTRTRNAEMLVAVTRVREGGRQQRRALGRMLLAAGVAMRSLAQDPVWFPTDSGGGGGPTASRLVAEMGVADIVFDREVPSAWRPYYLQSLANSIRDLRRVFPSLQLADLHVRFRLNAPADSALAMHDPRTRTLHLPIFTAGGTLSHELAHDLDRQSAAQLGLAGYRSDVVARGSANTNVRASSPGGRLAASLRALTEELSESPRAPSAVAERPAEIFATRVDWFVANALARKGISSGFLSAVQDELLTGHVVHPERLRGSGRTSSLLTALEGMTAVAPFAREEEGTSVQTLLRWSLAGPVDRQAATGIIRDGRRVWLPAPLIGERACDGERNDRVGLIRLAAESRARGWLRLRARWTPEAQRSPWARAVLGQGPWSDASAEHRVAELRDHILVELASSVDLPAGLSAYAAPLALRARCGA